LNLALRILHKYKVLVRAGKFDDLIKATAKKFTSELHTVTDRCKIFEQSVGVLLKFALQHVEALQIMDVPELLTHIREVLKDATDSNKAETTGADEKMQETLVIHYLASLSAKMEDMDEDAVMENLEKENIIPALITQLTKHYNWYKIETLCAASKFFSNCMASEAFGADKEKYITSKEQQQGLISLKGYFIAELVSTYGLKKKDVQALLDQLDKYEHVHGPAKITPLKPKATAALPAAATTKTEEQKEG